MSLVQLKNPLGTDSLLGLATGLVLGRSSMLHKEEGW